MKILIGGLGLGLFAISALAAPKLDPAFDHTGMDHAPITPQFQMALERDKRQHTFIQLFDDLESLEQGTFGYHIAEFGSNHQHQLILRGDNTIEGKSLKDSLPLIKGVFSKAPTRGYYSVTSDGPKEGYERFLLKEIILGQRREFPTSLYDGIIGEAPPVKKPWRYDVKKVVFTTPMIANDKIRDENIYIVFGLHDGEAAKKKYFMAHLVFGHEDNFDHLIAVEFDSEVVIPNGTMMVIEDVAVETPLALKKKYNGKIGEKDPLPFRVTKEFRKFMFPANLPN
jgi:hypothetical protein